MPVFASLEARSAQVVERAQRRVRNKRRLQRLHHAAVKRAYSRRMAFIRRQEIGPLWSIRPAWRLHVHELPADRAARRAEKDRVRQREKRAKRLSGYDRIGRRLAHPKGCPCYDCLFGKAALRDRPACRVAV